MSNPTFRHGPITFEAESTVEKFRFVELGAKGIKHAESSVFGAVTDAAAPFAGREAGDLTRGVPEKTAVHYAPAVVPIEVVEGETFATGAAVYAGADGKASTTGTTVAGIAVRESANGFVKTLLAAPAVAGA